MAGLSVCKAEHDVSGSEQNCAHRDTKSHHSKGQRGQGEMSRKWSDQELGRLFGHPAFFQRVSPELCFQRQNWSLSQEPSQELRSLKWANKKLSGQTEGLDISLCQQV